MNRTLFLTIASCAFFWLVACDRINPDSASSRAFVEDNAVASVLSTLTGKNDTSFDGKKYEPVYGEVLDDSNPGTYIAMCSRLSADSANEAPSVESLFYNGEKQFKGRFYESGSIAVYTVYVRYFSNNSWYGQEVALGES